MTTLPNMSLDLPVRGSPGSGLWGNTLDSDLGKIDAHDHTTGRGLPIPTAGLNINADLSFSALYAPKNLHRLQFSAIAGGALTGSNNLSLFVSDGTGGLTANELYFRTSAGNNVKFTSGSALNVGAFVGGIGGDYTSVSALLSYDDANKQYKHLVGGGTNWARGTFGGVRLVEFNTSETVYVEQLAPAALGASYSMTWPTALPGSAQAVQVDNTGAISFSNTFAQAVTFSALATANAGVTAGANQHITVSGTGRFKHGTLTLQIPAHMFVAAASTTVTYGGTTGNVGLAGSSMQCVSPIQLPQGARITAIRVFIGDNVTGPSKVTATFYSIPMNTGGSITSIASSSESAGSGATQTLTIGSLTTTVSTNKGYALQVLETTGSASCAVFGAEVDYDWP